MYWKYKNYCNKEIIITEIIIEEIINQIISIEMNIIIYLIKIYSVSTKKINTNMNKNLKNLRRWICKTKKIDKSQGIQTNKDSDNNRAPFFYQMIKIILII